MKFSHTTLATLVSLPLALAGINCRGSMDCHSPPDKPLPAIPWKNAKYWGPGDDSEPHVKTLRNYIRELPDDMWIPNDRHIACSRTICAFLQGTEGLHAWKVKIMAEFIWMHGCKHCGSAPTYYPQINNGSYGELTFNFVTERCGHVLDDICPEFKTKMIQGVKGLGAPEGEGRYDD